MRRIASAFILFFTITIFSQTAENPIKIETSVKKISETKYDIIFSAKLYKGWYLYSQYNPENEGAVALTKKTTKQAKLNGYYQLYRQSLG